jgi:predicted nucleic acid-binding protein
VIADASVVTAALITKTSAGSWARELLAAGRVDAPHLLPAEVCQVLRRLVSAGLTSTVSGRDAVTGLAELRIDLHPFEPFMARVWELRDTVSAYDAWYVALAEAMDVPLATLDHRLAGAPGPRCAFLVPDVGDLV